MRKKNLTELIKEAKEIHHNFYDYSRITTYNGIDAKNEIVCPTHGMFYQSFYYHINKKCGCKLCGLERAKSTKVLPIEVVKDRIVSCGYEIPENFSYVNNNTKITLICKKHGEFSILPSLLFRGERCKKCSFEKVSKKLMLDNNEFINRIKALYGDKIDASNALYKGNNKKVDVICKKHGPFQTTPFSLYQGISCKECKKEKLRNIRRKTQEQFLKESKMLYRDELDLSMVEYIDENTLVLIGCPTHGYFKQTPKVHLRGNGCPLCSKSKLERHVKRLLDNKSFEYVCEYKLPDSLLMIGFLFTKI